MTDDLIGYASILFFVVVFTVVNVQKAKIGWSFVRQEDKNDLHS